MPEHMTRDDAEQFVRHLKLLKPEYPLRALRVIDWLDIIIAAHETGRKGEHNEKH